jgi:hypothetical protein
MTAFPTEAKFLDRIKYGDGVHEFTANDSFVPCCMCRTPTLWFDFIFEAPFCSLECFGKMCEEYNEAERQHYEKWKDVPVEEDWLV